MIPTRPLRRSRLFIVGCGDVGLRTANLLPAHLKVMALSRRADGDQRLRHAGVTPLRGDLDDRASLKRLARLTGSLFGMFHFAPPAARGESDDRTRNLLAAMMSRKGRRVGTQISVRPTAIWLNAKKQKAGRAVAKRGPTFAGRTGCGAIVTEPPGGRTWRRGGLPLIYMSTSGVYGDCGGALIDETRQVRPTNARAVRRVSAEQRLRRVGQGQPRFVRGLGWRQRGKGPQGRPPMGIRPSILRVPGIYGAERLPKARLERGTPVLNEADDVFTCHIQVDDLAAIAVRALWRGAPQRIYHASDDSRLKMGAYFTAVADALALPHPPRISREEAERQIEPTMMSFMRESRQLANTRLTRELGYTLLYPTVDDFLRAYVAGARGD